MPDPEKLADMPFPAQGVDVSCEYEFQSQLTTPVGVNVRTYEPSTNRARGGSRPGLSKYIASQPNGANVLQMLNVIVDPSGLALPLAALLTGNDPIVLLGLGPLVPITTPVTPATDAAGDIVLDPSTGSRNPGRMFRLGGSGYQHNRIKFSRRGSAPPSGSVQFVQGSGATYLGAGDNGVTTAAFAFSGSVSSGNLIIVAFIPDSPSVPPVSVTDTLGTTFTLLSSPAQTNNIQPLVYWGAAPSSGSDTVTVVFQRANVTAGIVSEWSGADSATPIGPCVRYQNGSVVPNLTPFTADLSSVSVTVMNAVPVGFFTLTHPPNNATDSISAATLGSSTIRVSEAFIPNFPAITLVLAQVGASSVGLSDVSISGSYTYTPAAGDIRSDGFGLTINPAR